MCTSTASTRGSHALLLQARLELGAHVGGQALKALHPAHATHARRRRWRLLEQLDGLLVAAAQAAAHGIHTPVRALDEHVVAAVDGLAELHRLRAALRRHGDARVLATSIGNIAHHARALRSMSEIGVKLNWRTEVNEMYWIWETSIDENELDAMIYGVPEALKMLREFGIRFDDGNHINAEVPKIIIDRDGDSQGHLNDNLVAPGTSGLLFSAKLRSVLANCVVDNIEYFL